MTNIIFDPLDSDYYFIISKVVYLSLLKFKFLMQVIVWNSTNWKKLRDRNLQIHGQNVPQISSEIQIQFHPDQQKFLVVHNSHLGIYEATELKCVNQVLFFFFYFTYD